MRTFKDNVPREWQVAINVTSIKRVRDLAKYDLLSVSKTSNPLTELAADPVKLCDVLYCLVKADADKLNVTDEDFGRAMAGDALLAGYNALAEELVDFSQSPQARANQKRVLTTLRATAQKAEALVTAALDNGLLDREAEKVLSTFGAEFGGSPGSSESTPAPSPSVT
jgi:hypothetical protein